MYAAWAGAAGAMLSKGLIALVLPGAVLVLYILLQRDWGMLKRLHLVSGTLLFLALAAPWFVAVSLKNPEFFNFFFIHEHFNRFLTKVHARYQPWWYFVPILLAGILPWLFHLGETLLGAWRNEPSKKFQPRRFLLIWAVFIFLFFSRSDSKLPSYILPIFPALALLMGERFSRIGGRRLLWLTAPLLPLALAAMLLAPRAVSMADADAPLALYQNYVPWLVAAGAVFAVGVIAAMVLSRREAIGPALASIAFSGLLASQLVLTGHEELAPAHSSYLLAEKVKPYLKPDTPFYSVYFYEQTLPFLIKRPVTVVEFLDELEFGIRQEPDKWLALERDFLEVWKTLPYGLAIMKLETYAKFVEWKVPMVLIAKDNRAAIVRTP
jgi:4-amino-4-deoxy-L-arabinose transferase-like glycosyltransferase